MIRKQALTLAAFAALAAAGTTARADDITMANETFMSSKTRAEVAAEVLQAKAAGAVFASEIDLSTTMPVRRESSRTRAEVRAEVGEASRKALALWYPA